MQQAADHHHTCRHSATVVESRDISKVITLAIKSLQTVSSLIVMVGLSIPAKQAHADVVDIFHIRDKRNGNEGCHAMLSLRWRR